jgi:diacylglycerol kinase (ATP)
MNYLFILNPISGPKNRAKKVMDYIDQKMRQAQHEYDFTFTEGPGDATRIARQAIENGIDIVVAAGGDGTINEVASGLVGNQGKLGIIPLGSGNGIARSLNIPIAIDECLEFLIHPAIRRIDVGVINNRFFFGICGIGFDAEIGKKFQEFGVRGPLPYFMIGVKEYLFYQPKYFQLEFNNIKKEVRALLVAIANTKQYGNGAVIAPDANPEDGLLDLCIVYKVAAWKAAGNAYKLFRGQINQTGFYEHHRCKSVRIVSPLYTSVVHTDGEPLELGNNLEIKLMTKALNVCAPGI